MIITGCQLQGYNFNPPARWDTFAPPFTIVDTNDLAFFAGNWEEHSDNQVCMLGSYPTQYVSAAKILFFFICAKDSDREEQVYLALGLPEGATFSEQVFTWIPSAEQVGEHTVTFVVSNHQSLDFTTVQIIVNDEQ